MRCGGYVVDVCVSAITTGSNSQDCCELQTEQLTDFSPAGSTGHKAGLGWTGHWGVISYRSVCPLPCPVIATKYKYKFTQRMDFIEQNDHHLRNILSLMLS